MMTNVLIVDDQPITWLGMESIVGNVIKEAQFNFASTFDEAVEYCEQSAYDLILLDLSLPGGLGVEMIGKLRSIQKDVRILICSGRDEITNAPVYIHKGANGFVNKTAPNEQIEEAVRMVLADKRYVSAEVQRNILDRFVDGVAYPSNPIETLSPREREILDLLLAGKWTKEISDILGIKFSTVSTHKTRIFDKMQVDNILELSKKVELYGVEH
ncbi:DNA-binding NarL/FixJ family response regulator [Dyadobacter jejuensis]|uniref:DNA-binding NarL/FixJ family response regulator n=1 Tax=Dyadobacter jejuensis TaxID=1082580 RepID=A0A316ANW3_9BACT|nr:response regulator transcription factor [Dyadobacter jejuensis]PWJ59383.1 DNA-binding NarL/FixJ family response regulator [Dyadobacter jejuensis]